MVDIKKRVKTCILVFLLIASMMLSYFMIFSSKSPIKAIDNLWTEHFTVLTEKDKDAEGYYMVKEAGHLAYISAYFTKFQYKKIRLYTNINLSGYNWVPIPAFSGIFDGQNYSINNMYISEDDNLGFFCELSSAIVKRVNFNSCTIYPALQGGVVTSTSLNSNLQNIVVNNCNVIAANQKTYKAVDLRAGGICGYSENSSFTSCFVVNTNINAYNLKDQNYAYNTIIGGICGQIKYGTISCSYFSNGNAKTLEDGKNRAYSSYVGGIVGHGFYSTIQKSYNYSEIYANSDSYTFTKSPKSYAGGIAGYGQGLTINNCYNRGYVHSFATSYTSTEEFDGTVYDLANGVSVGEKGFYAENVNFANKWDLYMTMGSAKIKEKVKTNKKDKKIKAKNYAGTYLDTVDKHTKLDVQFDTYTGGLIGCAISESSVQNSYNTGDVNTFSKYNDTEITIPKRIYTLYFKWVGIKGETGNCECYSNLLLKTIIEYDLINNLNLGNIMGYSSASLSNNCYISSISVKSNIKINQYYNIEGKEQTKKPTLMQWVDSRASYTFKENKSTSWYLEGDGKLFYYTYFDINASDSKTIKFSATYCGDYYTRDRVQYYSLSTGLSDTTRYLDQGGSIGVTASKLGSSVWGADSNINNGWPYLKDLYW